MDSGQEQKNKNQSFLLWRIIARDRETREFMGALGGTHKLEHVMNSRNGQVRILNT